MPKYPDIEVTLSGQDGNALHVVGTVRRALEKNDVPRTEVLEFVQEALSGDYDHLLRTCVKWVSVE